MSVLHIVSPTPILRFHLQWYYSKTYGHFNKFQVKNDLMFLIIKNKNEPDWHIKFSLCSEPLFEIPALSTTDAIVIYLAPMATKCCVEHLV